MTIFEIARNVHIYNIAHRYCTNEIKQKGNKWLMLCPFHHEKTSSLTIYQNSSFYCFGCGAGGDGIAFVSQLFDLQPVDAARMICRDFNLSTDKVTITSRKKIIEAQVDREIEKNFKYWLNESYESLCVLHRVIEKILNEQDSELDYTKLLIMQHLTIEQLNILQHGPVDQQIHLYKSWHQRGFGFCD